MITRRASIAVAMIALLCASRVSAQDSTAARADSLLRRARQLVASGETAAARALADTLMQATAAGSDARAEALFLRATIASNVTQAQTDYRTIIVEHRLSPRAPDAMLRIGQAEYAGGDRAAARRQFERLVLEYAGSTAAGEAWYWLGRVRADDGDVAGGCAALDTARILLPPNDVERRNRVTFAAQRCRSLAAAPATTPPAAASPPAQPPAAATPAARWSAQVAAYRTRREAENLVASLKTRGHEARVDSLAASPSFRVRIGAFANRAGADSLVRRLTSQRITAFVVEAIRRAP